MQKMQETIFCLTQNFIAKRLWLIASPESAYFWCPSGAQLKACTALQLLVRTSQSWPRAKSRSSREAGRVLWVLPSSYASPKSAYFWCSGILAEHLNLHFEVARV